MDQPIPLGEWLIDFDDDVGCYDDEDDVGIQLENGVDWKLWLSLYYYYHNPGRHQL